MDQGRYELMDVIGSGGMATVWRARDTRLGRVVALKRPHPAPSDSTVLERFAREARAAATVHHPNLVSVFDVGEDETGPYLVMEYVDGPSLAAATVPPDAVPRIGAQLASALAALHGAGIVHGDVKPANVLLAPVGAKLTDFGIARTGDDTALTKEGMVYATPQYAAPETLAGRGRTAAADVYALGALLHELVTGHRWDAGASVTRPMPPPPWAGLLTSVLSPDPDIRPSADEFRARLADLDDPTGVPSTPVAPVPLPAAATTAVLAPPPVVSPQGGDGRTRARAATAVVAASVLGLAAVIGLASMGDDDLDAAVTSPEATAPATTLPPAATDPTVTEALPPQPSPAPADAVSPAGTIVAELIAVLDGLVAEGALDTKEAGKILDDVDRAVAAAAEGRPDVVEGALRDASGRIERSIDDDGREVALDRMAALAVELGVDPGRLQRGNGGGDDDGDDDD
jgi:serine/threonine protein kinase